jgi:hypothetical protein
MGDGLESLGQLALAQGVAKVIRQGHRTHGVDHSHGAEGHQNDLVTPEANDDGQCAREHCPDHAQQGHPQGGRDVASIHGEVSRLVLVHYASRHPLPTRLPGAPELRSSNTT